MADAQIDKAMTCSTTASVFPRANIMPQGSSHSLVSSSARSDGAVKPTMFSPSSNSPRNKYQQERVSEDNTATEYKFYSTGSLEKSSPRTAETSESQAPRYQPYDL